MNKDINYLIEYLAKSEDIFYKDILDFFTKKEIYIPTKYSAKAIKVLAEKSGLNMSNPATLIGEKLKNEFSNELLQAKQQLFETLIGSNFKKKKEQFDKVETSIYKCLNAYINGLIRALELFVLYAKEQSPEIFIEYANTLHVKLINSVFNKDEIELLEDKLKEIMGVYLALYARELYAQPKPN